MKTIIDLSGITNKDGVLGAFGETFEFGGPNGNVPVTDPAQKTGWGMNWDALTDCMRSLEEGGIWETSKKFEFPLEIDIQNSMEFQTQSPEDFQTLQEILQNLTEEYAVAGKVLKVAYA